MLGVSESDEYWVRPSAPPTVPRSSVMVWFAAPVVQPVMEIVAGLGLVLASVPSSLKTMSIDPVTVPDVTDESDDRVALLKLAVQLFSPVFSQVMVTLLAVPSESYTSIVVVKVALVAASAGRFASMISVVVAEATPQLFSGALRDELDARGTATEAEVLAAVSTADAHDVLDSVPDGLAGELPEKGRSLSGGQRQRVALARALLTQAEVLVLVEPTSAVDAHTEARIAARLADARRGRATLVVTASPLVLDHVDEVQLVHDGRLVARGTHAALLDGEAGPQVAALYRRVVGRNLDDDLPVEQTFADAEPDARALTQPTTTPGGAA